MVLTLLFPLFPKSSASPSTPMPIIHDDPHVDFTLPTPRPIQPTTKPPPVKNHDWIWSDYCWVLRHKRQQHHETEARRHLRAAVQLRNHPPPVQTRRPPYPRRTPPFHAVDISRAYHRHPSHPTRSGAAPTPEIAYALVAHDVNDATPANTHHAYSAITDHSPFWFNDSSTTKYPVIWDSGASVSISPDPNDFVGPIEVPAPGSRILGLTNHADVTGSGTVAWQMADENGKLTTVKTKALLVPSVNFRLLSVPTFCSDNKNATITFHHNSATLTGPFGTIHASNTSGGLPFCDAYPPDYGQPEAIALFSIADTCHPTNLNLSPAAKELLRWHNRLGHYAFKLIQHLLRMGSLGHTEATRKVQTIAAKLTETPSCAACLFGKQTLRSVPTNTTGKVTDSIGALKKSSNFAGQHISVDHFVSKTAGRLFTSKGKSAEKDKFCGACVFVAHFSGLIHVEFQTTFNTHETFRSKTAFETFCRDHAVTPQNYLSDNGTAFTSQEYTQHLQAFAQVTKFAGPGAHHHNGIAERAIRTIVTNARTMMLHSALHWPTASDTTLWPMAVQHSTYLYNRLPAIDSGLSPFDKFTRTRTKTTQLADMHVWGCPTYHLNRGITNGMKPPRWDPRSSRGVYMGNSTKYASTDPLVLDLITGSITPKFHVVFDDYFHTIAEDGESHPDFTDQEWTQLFGDSCYNYDIEDEEDLSGIITTATDLRLQHQARVENAMNDHAPPHPLPFDTPAIPLPQKRLPVLQPILRRPVPPPILPPVVPTAPVVQREQPPTTAPVLPIPAPVIPAPVVQREQPLPFVPPLPLVPIIPRQLNPNADDATTGDVWTLQQRRQRRSPPSTTTPPTPGPTRVTQPTPAATTTPTRRISFDPTIPPNPPDRVSTQPRRSNRNRRTITRMNLFAQHDVDDDPPSTPTNYSYPDDHNYNAATLIITPSPPTYPMYMAVSDLEPTAALVDNHDAPLPISTYDPFHALHPICFYLHTALTEVTPAPFSASTLICADVFKVTTGDPDTLSFDGAMNDPIHRDKWRAAAATEIHSLETHGTWTLDHASNATDRILPGTWVFRKKRAPNATITKYKAHYCVRSDLQEGTCNTYAPVVSWATIRMIMVLSLVLEWATTVIDFNSAFVQALLPSPVWIHLPRGFHSDNNQPRQTLCLRLLKSLYGLDEAPKLWYKHLFNALVNTLKFKQSLHDPCLLYRDGLMVVAFVDDLAIAYRTPELLNSFLTELCDLRFAFSDEGNLTKFLGINFERSADNSTMTLTQPGLIQRIITATGLSDCNPNHTPSTQIAIGSDPDGPNMIDAWHYRSIIGMLLYLSTNTRPDIAFAVSQVARFSNNPRQTHATAVKTIVRYLASTSTMGTIVQPTGRLNFDVYADADLAGLYRREPDATPSSVRSRTGYVIILGGFPLVWKSRLQTEIALSTMEAEYISLSSALRSFIPLRELLFEASTQVQLPSSITSSITSVAFEDNASALSLANNQQVTNRTRHLQIRYHHFWHYIRMNDTDRRRITCVHISTDLQHADLLTKGLSREKFENNRRLLLGW